MEACKRLQAQRELWAKTPSKLLTKEERLQKKMMRAKLRYVRRKRENAPPIDLGASERLCGKTLEYFDPERKRWFFANVLQFKTMWLDMGTRMQILHEIKLMGGSTETEGAVWVDLNASRYVIVPSNFLEVQLAREKVEAFEATQRKADEEAYAAFKKAEQKLAKRNAKRAKKKHAEFEDRMERLIPEGVAAAKEEALRRSIEDEHINRNVTMSGCLRDDFISLIVLNERCVNQSLCHTCSCTGKACRAPNCRQFSGRTQQRAGGEAHV